MIWLDEVGRWPLAGPVTVGGVFCLPWFSYTHYPWATMITDSKKLTAKKREYLTEQLLSCSDVVWATSSVSARYIDRYGIVAAIRTAFLDVIDQIIKKVTPLFWDEFVENLEILLDGKTDYGLRKMFAISDKLQAVRLETIIRWDSSIREIGAASIVAKVQRDDYMTKIWSKKKYQFYEFDRHKWYGTLLHRTAIAEYGLSNQHRKSFCRKIKG